ncbi:hypothetical protein ACC808_22085 [Rhizobium ruizarguesonis]
MTEADPTLDGPALGALATAIADAFSAGDLEEAVLVDLDQDIYAVYAAPGTAINPLALALVVGLKQRGWVLRFLRAARKRRPDNGPLMVTIQQFCPAALQDELPASASVAVVVDVLGRIKARLADPDFASAVNDSRADLGSLANGLVRLRVYKSLHDVLQKCQVSQFSLLTEYIRRLHTDPQASVTLGALLLDLKITFDKARRSLSPLEGSPDAAEETSWIDIVADSLKNIGEARDSLDDRAARIAALRIRDQLQSQPSRINGLLRTEARRLPLRRLGEAIASASEAAGLTTEQRNALKSGVDSVTELRLRLERRVADHDRWQLVERQLWLLDNVVARPDSPIEEFEDYWQIAKESILPLWNADAKADWVVATQGYGATIDEALAAKPPETSSAKSKYGDFRSQALWQFFSVDGDLSDLCENVLQISAPVVTLLKGNG